MTLIELAEEYRNEAEKLNRKIDFLRVEAKTAIGKELYYLRKRIKILKDMRRECRYTATVLEHYYDKNEE